MYKELELNIVTDAIKSVKVTLMVARSNLVCFFSLLISQPECWCSCWDHRSNNISGGILCWAVGGICYCILLHPEAEGPILS